MELGGDDQWSNILGGLDLCRRKDKKQVYGMTFTLLTTSEGKKMGKTASGAVWLDKNKTSVYDFYQYWRNVEDDDVLKCIKMLTFLSLEEIEKMESWQGAELNKAKEILAYELTALVHGEEEAKKAQDSAKALFVGGGDDSNMPTTKLVFEGEEIALIDVLVDTKLCASRGEAKKLIQQGGISVEEEKISDLGYKFKREALTSGIKIKKGKKIYHKIIS